MLEPLGSVDTVSRDYINKIRQHAEVLQSSSLRLSSKAEGFGAVQQVSGRSMMASNKELGPDVLSLLVLKHCK